MTRFFPGRSTQMLIVATIALMLIVGAELSFPAGPAAHVTETPEPELSGLPSFDRVELNVPPMGAFVDMVERPLFFANRQMPEPEKAEPPPPPTPLRLKLIGVAISEGARVALLRSLVNNQLIQLAEGDSHDGWTLDALDAQAASFSRGPQTTELPLEQRDSQGPRRR